MTVLSADDIIRSTNLRSADAARIYFTAIFLTKAAFVFTPFLSG